MTNQDPKDAIESVLVADSLALAQPLHHGYAAAALVDRTNRHRVDLSWASAGGSL